MMLSTQRGQTSLYDRQSCRYQSKRRPWQWKIWWCILPEGDHINIQHQHQTWPHLCHPQQSTEKLPPVKHATQRVKRIHQKALMKSVHKQPKWYPAAKNGKPAEVKRSDRKRINHPHEGKWKEMLMLPQPWGTTSNKNDEIRSHPRGTTSENPETW